MGKFCDYLQISRGTFILTVCESSQPYATIVQVSVVCIHFTIFFQFTSTAAPASLIVVRKLTDYTRNESSREHSLPGTFAPGNFRSPERKFPGTFVPGSDSSRELSFLGAKVPTGNFRSEERKYRGAKSPECWNIRSQDYSFPGTFVPMMELSFSGTFVPWNFRSRDRSFPRPNITRKIHFLDYNHSNTSFTAYVK